LEHARQIEQELATLGIVVPPGTLKAGMTGAIAAEVISRLLGDPRLRSLSGRLQALLAQTRRRDPAAGAATGERPPAPPGDAPRPPGKIPEVRPDQPISFWPADGSTRDMRGSNHGTLINGAGYADAGFGQAFMLARPDQWVDLGNSASLRFSRKPFTLSAWAWFAGATGQDATILSKMAASGRDGWKLHKFDNDRFAFCLGAGDEDGCAAEAPTSLSGRTAASARSWYHVAVVRGSKDMWLFVNGEAEADKPVPDFVDTHESQMAVGGPGFVGMVDEIEVYDRALSAAAIKAIASPVARSGDGSGRPRSPTEVAGTPPFAGDDIARAIAVEPAPQLLGIDGGIGDVVAMALAKRPQDRPQTAGELVDRFRRAMEGGASGAGTAARTPGSPAGAPPAPRSAPGLATIGAVLVGAAIVGFVLAIRIFWLIGRTAVQAIARMRSPDLAPLAQASATVLLTTILLSVTTPTLYSPPLNYMFWLLAGVQCRLRDLELAAVRARAGAGVAPGAPGGRAGAFGGACDP
jgi:hypothetical protein